MEKENRILKCAAYIEANLKEELSVKCISGWETHSGFTRSFCSQFGYSPVLLRVFFIRDASL